MLTVVLRIRHQPRRRSNYRIAARGQNARRDSSCRSASLFNQYGAAAGGARNGVLSLPAPDGGTKPLGGSPVKKQGSGGRRDRALLNAREPPPAVFWFLLYRYKRNSPAGEIHTCLFVARQNGRMISAPTKTGSTCGQIWLPSLNVSPVGRRGEAKLRRTFFAKLSFKKAGKKAGRPPYII